MYNLRVPLGVILLIVLAGCASNSVENPNLAAPVNPEKAEVVGSKIAGEGGIPHQIYVSAMDGQRWKYNAVDLTLKIWPVNPGIHEFQVEYAGSSGKVFITPFIATGKVSAELASGHRYILRIRAVNDRSIIFFFEDQSDGRIVAESTSVELSGVALPVFVPR